LGLLTTVKPPALRERHDLEAYPRLVGNENACGQPSAGLLDGAGETELMEAGTTESAHVRTF
jgi:hypothetical protein